MGKQQIIIDDILRRDKIDFQPPSAEEVRITKEKLTQLQQEDNTLSNLIKLMQDNLVDLATDYEYDDYAYVTF